MEPIRAALAAEPASPWAHVLDVIFFRGLGVCLLIGEAHWWTPADWPLIVAGVCMFFMPDWLRGRSSLPASVLRAFLERGSR